MKQSDYDELKRLKKRVERLFEEYEKKAPMVIKNFELELIIESCRRLKETL